jgi:hypothetical protein
VGDQEVFGKGSRDLALVAKEASKEPSKEPSCQVRDRPSVVGVARGEAQREHLATSIDDQVECAAVEPPH